MAAVRNPIPGVEYPSASDLRSYKSMGILRDETMPAAFRKIARKFPDRPALRDTATVLTFRELDLRSDLIAAGLLRAGLAPKDRVIFQLVNRIELVVLFIACLKAGLIPVCTLAAHRRAEIEFIARHSGARAHIVQGDAQKFDFVSFAKGIRQDCPDMALTILVSGKAKDQPEEVTLEDLAVDLTPQEASTILETVPEDPLQVAVFQLSGGTSGTPKIIPRFHNEYLYQMRQTAEFQGIDEETVAFSPAPMMHNAPIVCYWGSILWSGGSVVCNPGMDAQSLARTIAECRPNWMSIPLPLLMKMAKAGVLNKEHFKGARLATSGNAPRMSALTGAETLPLYGMTEGMISFYRKGDPDVVWRSMVGRPVSPYDDVRIIDPDSGLDLPMGKRGEFCFKGPTSCRGYFNAPERNATAFTEDKYFKSGDLMSMHEIDGTVYLKFEGRLKDVVSRGGEKINCLEMEQYLIGHPSIGSIAIVPMPDVDYGERACAFLILAPGHDAPTVADLGDFLEQAGVAKFKWPEQVIVVDAFPTTSSGKLSKPLLCEMAAKIAAEENQVSQSA